MKKWFVVASLILIIALAALGNLTSAAPAGIVYREGTNFYLDGKPYYFAGCNSYDLFTYGDGSNDSTTDYIENYFMNKKGIDTIMSQMAADGVKVVRTWGFSHETWHGFEPAQGQYNEAQFMLFDYIMESAKKNGIKVMIVLENYWEAYGGIDKRLAWEGLPGVSHVNRAKFFTNEGCKEQYRNYVKHFVSRVNHYTNVAYKNDPTLFAWE
ncbi:MAG TPA: beta-galactosidase, partial [Bacillota bacterium]|nr:beta-galactosidase [Bacillota bacterium]